MKKIFIIIAAIAAVGVGYWLISPLFREEVVNERLEDIMPTPPAGGQAQQQTQVISLGTFSGLAGHNAEGTAKLLKIGEEFYIRFEDDFKVTNGPDLFVHFGKDGQYLANTRLGNLKGNIGGQNYKVPAELNTADFNEVWVWCRSFSVPFGKAQLK